MSEDGTRTSAQTQAASRLKHWLQRACGSQCPLAEAEEGAATHKDPCKWRALRTKLVVALVVFLALVVMGLLLLWNYQCIMVWQLCHQEDEYSSLVEFEEEMRVNRQG